VIERGAEWVNLKSFPRKRFRVIGLGCAGGQDTYSGGHQSMFILSVYEYEPSRREAELEYTSRWVPENFREQAPALAPQSKWIVFLVLIKPSRVRLGPFPACRAERPDFVFEGGQCLMAPDPT
jgi:hypothetical protein